MVLNNRLLEYMVGFILKVFWFGVFGIIIGILVVFKVVGGFFGLDGWKVEILEILF